MNEIMEKIKKGNIKMKPKWEFALKSILLVLLSLVSLLLLLFITSFFLKFGFFVSFRVFPWMIVLTIAGFVVLLEFLINRYAAAYRKPVIYSVIAIIIVIFLASTIMNAARFHEMIEKRNMPMIRKIYDRPIIKPMMHPKMQEFEIKGPDRL